MVTDLTETAANSTGVATEKMNIYLDSVEAKTNQLKTAWEEFVLSLSQSDSWKQVLDVAIGLVENLPQIFQIIKTIGALAIVANLEKIANTGHIILLGLQEMLPTLSALSLENLKGTKIIQSKLLLQLQEIAANKELEEGRKRAIISSTINRSKINEETKAKLLDTIAQKGLNKALQEYTTVGAIALGLIQSFTLALTLAYAGMNIYINHIHKLQEASNESLKTTQEKIDKTEDEIKTLKEVKDKYIEIYKTTTDVTERYNQLKTLSSEVAEIYGSESEALNVLSGSYEDVIQKMDELEIKKNKQRIDEERELVNGANSSYGAYNQKIADWDDLVVDLSAYGLTTNSKAVKVIKQINDFWEKNSDGWASIGGNWRSPLEFEDELVKDFELNNSVTQKLAILYAESLKNQLDNYSYDWTVADKNAIQSIVDSIMTAVSQEAKDAWEAEKNLQLEEGILYNNDGSKTEDYQKFEEIQKRFNELRDNYSTTESQSNKKAILDDIKNLEQEYNEVMNRMSQEASKISMSTADSVRTMFKRDWIKRLSFKY